jgi:hypothetical protein
VKHHAGLRKIGTDGDENAEGDDDLERAVLLSWFRREVRLSDPLAEGPQRGYVWSMTLEAIKEAIEQLPPDQQTVLARWLGERDWNAWDDQIESDFSAGGRGAPVLADLEREIAEGQSRPMEEGLAERRKLRP